MIILVMKHTKVFSHSSCESSRLCEFKSLLQIYWDVEYWIFMLLNLVFLCPLEFPIHWSNINHLPPKNQLFQTLSFIQKITKCFFYSNFHVFYTCLVFPFTILSPWIFLCVICLRVICFYLVVATFFSLKGSLRVWNLGETLSERWI
jgi:hypothetical protein